MFFFIIGSGSDPVQNLVYPPGSSAESSLTYRIRIQNASRLYHVGRIHVNLYPDLDLVNLNPDPQLWLLDGTYRSC